MSTKVRLDKWLWAARFFKTRTLAKAAIEGGKVRYQGNRTKPSKEVEIGALLHLPQGWDQLEVEILAVSEQRRSATEAQTLYQETPASQQKRQQAAQQRRLARELGLAPETSQRPNKKQRRQLEQWQQQTP
ncbi:ribosome-associated heat shock protein Hsp15 [Allopseudospirillum japonicum]|uniref:Heat shock protein 15 n=1 Tax=Allopseudospirillum japonicum TaxID=64971 RepID=A0A1H6RW15_9GAMM|nr:S4 domain-containing protein [Allopseudospirillum japonicum]SEI57684.1 ribosome-associated heat shock protein Hsp15 [Allopseudospirillum japonicum]